MTVLGFVEVDGVWVDDRRTGTWALRGLSLATEPGAVVALTGDVVAAHALLDLLVGRRAPVRGRVAVDGVDLRDLDRSEIAELAAELLELDGGERRVVIGATTVVAEPRPATTATASTVVWLADGIEVERATVAA